jgi:astacin
MGFFFEEGFELRMRARELGPLSVDRSGREYVLIDDEAYYVHSRDGLEIRTFPGAMWPQGKVYYQFAAGLDGTKKLAFNDAGALWSAVAKVSFTETAHPNGYVLVEDSTTNVSAVGFTKIKGQLFKITSWDNKYIIAHEIAHALGMTHEHKRSDRDQYVIIHEANIQPDKLDNFSPPVSSINYTDYDYESVMHYGSHDFALNIALPTISVKPPNTFDPDLLGQRTKLSTNDKADMKAKYGAP